MVGWEIRSSAWRWLSLFTVDVAVIVVVGFFFALSFVLSVFSFCARFLDGPRRVAKYAAAAAFCLCVCVCVCVFVCFACLRHCPL